MYCCVSTAKWFRERPTMLHFTYTAYLVERNYVPPNLHSYHTLHVKAALKQKNVRLPMAFFRRKNLAKQIATTDESLHSVSVFVSVAVKHFTTSDEINHL
jgi:hypothetical protein